jgi:hypothetical protein
LVRQAKGIASVKGIAPSGLFGLRFAWPLHQRKFKEEIQNGKAAIGA